MLDAAPPCRLDADDPDLGCYGISPRQGWLVAQTHPQAEFWANANLQRRGYKTYLPLVLRPRRDRSLPTLVHNVLVPLFSRYLFCWHDSRDPRRPIRETPGVHDIIRCGSEAQYAPEAAVSALQATEAARRSQPSEISQWAPGAPCSLRKGYAFEGMPAVVISVQRETASIAIMMLGHLRNVSVPLDCLKARDE